MAEKTYSEKLKDPRWQKKRLEIMDRDEWQCQFCLDKESTLNVHHLEYNGNPWEANSDQLVTLCEDCHFLVEDTKLPIVKGANLKLKFVLGSGTAFFIQNNDGGIKMVIHDTITNSISLNISITGESWNALHFHSKFNYAEKYGKKTD